MNRRGFLGAILAAGAAPAIIKVENAMRLWVPREPTWIGVDLALRNGEAYWLVMPPSGPPHRLYYEGEVWDQTVLDAVNRSVGILEIHRVPAGQAVKNISAATMMERLAVMRDGERIKV